MMHGESQATRLASLMQKHHTLPSYELALPLVTVLSSRLDSLKIEDILLLKQKRFTCILINNDTIFAEMILAKEHNRYVMKVVDLAKRKMPKTRRKLHDVLKLSFGNVYCSALQIGEVIEVSHIDLLRVQLVRKNKNIAEAFLLNVDGELALQIDKVIE
jgi:ribosomal protein L17